MSDEGAGDPPCRFRSSLRECFRSGRFGLAVMDRLAPGYRLWLSHRLVAAPPHPTSASLDHPLPAGQGGSSAMLLNRRPRECQRGGSPLATSASLGRPFPLGRGGSSARLLNRRPEECQRGGYLLPGGKRVVERSGDRVRGRCNQAVQSDMRQPCPLRGENCQDGQWLSRVRRLGRHPADRLHPHRVDGVCDISWATAFPHSVSHSLDTSPPSGGRGNAKMDAPQGERKCRDDERRSLTTACATALCRG